MAKAPNKNTFRTKLGKVQQALKDLAAEAQGIIHDPDFHMCVAKAIDEVTKAKDMLALPAVGEAPRITITPRVMAAGDQVRLRGDLNEELVTHYSQIPVELRSGWTLLRVQGATAVLAVPNVDDPIYVTVTHLEHTPIVASTGVA